MEYFNYSKEKNKIIMPKMRERHYKDEPCSDAAYINKMRYYGWNPVLIPKDSAEDIKIVFQQKNMFKETEKEIN